MGKKLTIGSLKYASATSAVSVSEFGMIETPVVKKSNGVEIEQNNRFFEVDMKKGQTILDAALEENLPLEYQCKKGTCGKCKVKLIKGSTNLHPVNRLEEKRLQQLIDEGYRLACQATAT